jgi:predicted Zn-dependent peptidase
VLEGSALESVEAAASAEIEHVRSAGIDVVEMARAKRQLRARLVFENDSVTNVAHQLGYFATLAEPDYFGSMQRRIDAVTPEQVWDVARRRLAPACRTVGWFRPLESR